MPANEPINRCCDFVFSYFRENEKLEKLFLHTKSESEKTDVGAVSCDPAAALLVLVFACFHFDIYNTRYAFFIFSKRDFKIEKQNIHSIIIFSVLELHF